jgi:hypothetical protein
MDYLGLELEDLLPAEAVEQIADVVSSQTLQVNADQINLGVVSAIPMC